MEIIAPGKAVIDTVWRSTPKSLWAEIIGEVRNGFRYMPHDVSVEEGDVD